MDCVNCKYADVSSGERVVTRGNMTLCQKSNGAICTCDHIKSITITDGKMVCSEYAERGNGTMDKKHLSILKAAISHYSVTVTKVITMEEMAELTKEISKSIRYGDINTENIAEEMADVEICLEFLRLIYNNAERVKEYKSQKIDRLAERIKGGGR